jgi:hypothetical protein
MTKIDWQRKADPQDVVGSATLILRPRGSGSRGGLESMTESTASSPAAKRASEHEQLDRLREALATTAPPVPDSERAEITEAVLAGARTGLAKVNQGESPENFTLGEHVGLESVILTNGTRPSLFVRNGFVDLEAPDVGDWAVGLGRFQEEIRKVVTSVGRIDIPVRPWFAGTCFVIAEGFVLTNRHVLEAIAGQDAAGAWTLKWADATTIDFVGEDGAGSRGTKFKVVGVAFAGPDPINNMINFAHLDIAVLRVEPASDVANSFPKAVIFETDVAQPKADRDLYVLGFPGQPQVWLFDGQPPTGSETAQVISILFNNKFGVKRLAPGSIKAGPGQVANDAKQWICTHDASTLGGNSGSCVVDLGQDGFRIIGLHFAGANRQQNWAHVAARLHDYLSGFSASFIA